MKDQEITNTIIGCAIKVYKELGPGLLESAYKECLAHALYKRGLKVEAEKTLPLSFEGITLQHAYRIDLLVERKIVIEVKSVEALNDVHKAQLLTYLKLGHFQIGILINFNVALLKQGIQRLVNNYIADDSTNL